MATMTLAIPDELKKQMAEFPEMNWSETARQAFAKKVEALRIFKKFQSESELTEEDALELGRKVNERAARKYGLIK